MSKATRLPKLALPPFSIFKAIPPFVFLVVSTVVHAAAAEPPADAAADPSATTPQPSVAGSLSVVERSVSQEQGGWIINHALRFSGTSNIVVTPADVILKMEGWVSNSRVKSHAVPKLSTVLIAGTSGLTATADILPSSDESKRCRERATIQVWADDPSVPPPALPGPPSSRSSSASPPPASSDRAVLLTLTPGMMVRTRIKIDHVHFLHGDYDPLLGDRTVDIQLGTATVRDVIPLDREQSMAQAKNTWPTPPDDRRDDRHFVSAPDSLHLEAHIPGNQYYTFPERPIRYATKMRLKYTYFIAQGTEGICRATVAQYKDTPTTYKVLSQGAHEECLKTVGRWVKVERIFKTEPEATTLALGFRIITNGEDVGEMWIDDVSLEPYGAPSVAGP